MTTKRSVVMFFVMHIFLLELFCYGSLQKPITKSNIIIFGVCKLNHPIDTGTIQVELSKKNSWRIKKTVTLLRLNFLL